MHHCQLWCRLEVSLFSHSLILDKPIFSLFSHQMWCRSQKKFFRAVWIGRTSKGFRSHQNFWWNSFSRRSKFKRNHRRRFSRKIWSLLMWITSESMLASISILCAWKRVSLRGALGSFVFAIVNKLSSVTFKIYHLSYGYLWLFEHYFSNSL